MEEEKKLLDEIQQHMKFQKIMQGGIDRYMNDVTAIQLNIDLSKKKQIDAQQKLDRARGVVKKLMTMKKEKKKTIEEDLKTKIRVNMMKLKKLRMKREKLITIGPKELVKKL